MNWRNRYKIEFKGLDNGLHHYDFIVDADFFKHFDTNFIEKGEVKANIVLEKRSRFLKMNFQLKGWIALTCDRCLDEYKQLLDYQNDIYVKFGDPAKNMDDDEVVWIDSDEHQFNVAQLIYEYITVSLPIKHIHADENDCNKEMLEKINQYKMVEKKEEQIDPRWDALKNLNINN